MSMSATDRVFFTGAIVKTGLAASKLVVGFLAGSQALVADGAHSVSDMVTNFGGWMIHRWAQHPPDEDHHYGHGNFESVASLIIGLILFAGGVGIIASAIFQEHHAKANYLGAGAIVISVLSIVLNLWLSRITRAIARTTHSPTLTALDRDHRSDALASLLVVIGVGGSILGAPWVERLFAAGIGLLVMRLGFESARDGFDVLMDRVTDPNLRGEIENLAKSVPGVLAVQSVRVHPIGPHLRIDMEISVEPTISVREGHAIAHHVDATVTKARPLIDEVHVHVNPHEAFVLTDAVHED